jgi:non-specific serine/threonine protein kinase
MAFARGHLAVGRLFAGDMTAALALTAEGAAISRAHGEQWFLSFALGLSVTPALILGEVPRAAAYARESLQACRGLHNATAVQAALEFLAWTAVAEQDYLRAARVFGATARLWRDIGGTPFAGPWAQRHQEQESATRAALGDASYESEYQCGYALSHDEAVAYALGEHQPPAKPKPDRDQQQPLTRRERQVADLVAQGLSNKQISTRLVISQRTAESHVENILTKLGFTSRAQIAAWHTAKQEPQAAE